MALFFVDRSRYNTGLGECMYARYMGYYHEYTGLSPKSFSIPLSTGGQTHAVLEYILYDLKENNLEISTEQVRKHIKTACDDYLKEADSSTWENFDTSNEILDYIVKEQTTLLEGLIWCWVENLIPWIKANYTIESIEQEYNIILGCTCGLGSFGTPENHNDKDCNGICLMTRPDLVLRNISTNNLAYIEFKTGAYIDSPSYAQRFYDNVQFVLGARAAEKFHEEDVTELFVHGLHKGGRKWNKEGTLKLQQSPLCYAFVKPGNPPLDKGDISPEYYKIITNQDGTTKKFGCTEKRGYSKVPVWTYPFQNIEEGMGSVEHYVKNIMTLEQRQSCVKVIGPIDNSSFLSDKLLVQMLHEESRWKDRVQIIAETAENSGSWESSETTEIVEELIPRSWQCKKYGEEYMCAYKPGCFEELGSTLLESDKYDRRNPNHPIEGEIGQFYNKAFEV